MANNITRQVAESFKVAQDEAESAVGSLPPGYITGFAPTINDDTMLVVGQGVASVDGVRVDAPETTLVHALWVVDPVANFTYFAYLTRSGGYFVDIVSPIWDSRSLYLGHPYRSGRFICQLTLDTDLTVLYCNVALTANLSALNLSVGLQNGSITTALIADNAVVSGKIAANTIEAGDIASNTITADEIASNTITASEIAANTITASEIASSTITTTEIAANTITADDIATTTLQALFAAIGYQITVGFGGTGEVGDPDSGDRRTYIDEDEIDFQEHNGTTWENKGYIARRTGSAVYDQFLSGFSMVGEAVLSSPGRIWIEGTNNFSGTVRAMAYGNDVVVAGTSSAEIERSTDGKAFGADITNNHTTTIATIGFGNDVFIAAGGLGELSRSTNDGVTWGSLVSNPFATGSDQINELAYDSDAGVWVAVGEASTIAARSTDDGASWAACTTAPGAACKDVAYVGNNTFVALSNNGYVYRSTDSGANFGAGVEVEAFSTWDDARMAYGNGTLVVLLHDSTPGDFAVYYSTDKGVTWTEGAAEITTDVIVHYALGMFFTNSQISTDGGRTFVNAGYSAGARSSGPVWALVYDQTNKVLVGGDTGGSTSYSEWMEAGCGIVEASSNANGEYRKLADGTMICYYNDPTLRTASTASGNIYRATTITYTFPATFYTGTTPTVVPRVNQSLGTVWMGDSSGTISTTQVSLTMLGSGSGAQGYPGYIAIGRWK